MLTFATVVLALILCFTTLRVVVLDSKVQKLERAAERVAARIARNK